MKTREEVIEQPYLNIADICKLLMISRPKAKMIFQECRRIEKSESNYIVYENKVAIETILKVTGKKFGTLQAQIKKG